MAKIKAFSLVDAHPRTNSVMVKIGDLVVVLHLGIETRFNKYRESRMKSTGTTVEINV